MAVLAMVKLKGDPDQILAAKEAHMDPVAEAPFRANGHIWQVVVKSEAELIVFNLWDSPEGRDRANAEPAMQTARQTILAVTGAEAKFLNWPVIEHKVTRV